MTNESLADLAVLSIEKEICRTLDLEEVVNIFASSGNHRIHLTL